VSHEAQRKRRLGFVPGQAGRRIQQHVQLGTVRQLAVFGGDPTGDVVQLLAGGQVVFQDDKQLLQLDGDLDHGREHDAERPVLFALGDLGGQGLDDLGTGHEPVEVDQHQQGRAVRGT